MGTSDFGDSVDVNSDLGEVFTETLAEVSLTRTIGRSQIGVRAFAAQEDYEDVPRDDDLDGSWPDVRSRPDASDQL